MRKQTQDTTEQKTDTERERGERRQMDRQSKILSSHHIFPSRPRLHSRDGGLKHLTWHAPRPWPHNAPVGPENSVSRGPSRPPIFVSITPPLRPPFLPSLPLIFGKEREEGERERECPVLFCVVLRCAVSPFCFPVLWDVLRCVALVLCAEGTFWDTLCCMFYFVREYVVWFVFLLSPKHVLVERDNLEYTK